MAAPSTAITSKSSPVALLYQVSISGRCGCTGAYLQSSYAECRAAVLTRLSSGYRIAAVARYRSPFPQLYMGWLECAAYSPGYAREHCLSSSAVPILEMRGARGFP